MYKFGKSSLKKLSTVHPELQITMQEALETSVIDFVITQGLRTVEEQFELYKKGRILKDNKWIIYNKDEIVTNCDGTVNKSNHQSGNAVDICAYMNGKLSWKDNLLINIGNHIMNTYDNLYKRGVVSKKLIWGKEWVHIRNGRGDLEHFEIKI